MNLFHWINGWSNSYAPFYDFLSEATKWIWVRIALGLIAIALIAAGPQTRKAAFLSLAGFLLANFITDQFKNYLPLLRPCVELFPNVVNHGVGFLDSKGTASAHAANTAAIAFVMTFFLRYWGLIPIAIAFFTGVARIYVGVHYPSQVLLGWACGVAAGAVLALLYRTYDKRKNPQSEGLPMGVEPGNLNG